MSMQVRETALPDVLVIEPDVFPDARGYLTVPFQREWFASAGLPTEFAQDNHSHSVRGVLRGLHFQLANPQGKLVTAISGEIFDVVADVRVGSPTFGKWIGETLSEGRPRYLWIPPGFAHGFAVLSDTANVLYKCTSFYAPGDQHGVRWNDPDIGIIWPTETPILSAADQAHPLLRDAGNALPRYAP